MKKLVSLILSILILLLVATEIEAQQLREVVKQVDASVVVVKTVEKNLLASPQTMFVSSPGSGSGVLISTDGKVLTAAHVVQAADKVEVEFVDGQTVPAKVISSVPNADVAMLKLDWVPYNAKPARLGDSDKMQVGDDVFILGAPYGMGHSLSAGHVSARRAPKNPAAATLSLELLQTDAAINKGNSGGPMFNLAGEVVGIVSSILSQSGGSEGLGFAITINVAQRLVIAKKGFWRDRWTIAFRWVGTHFQRSATGGTAGPTHRRQFSGGFDRFAGRHLQSGDRRQRDTGRRRHHSRSGWHCGAS